jgi:hypothetical protein
MCDEFVVTQRIGMPRRLATFVGILERVLKIGRVRDDQIVRALPILQRRAKGGYTILAGLLNSRLVNVYAFYLRLRTPLHQHARDESASGAYI